MIRYWSLSLLGMLVSLASLLLMTWARYHLVRTGTCASGGPYVSARPCPEGTGAKILGLTGAIFALLIGGGIYAARGNRGHGATLGMGIVLWSLLFISLAAATFVAAFGPANNDDPGARTAAIVLAIVFLPMGILPLIGVAGFGFGRKRLRSRASETVSQYPKPAPPQFNFSPPPTAPGAPAGDVAARLRKLDELRDSGLLTDDEFQAKKAEILREL